MNSSFRPTGRLQVGTTSGVRKGVIAAILDQIRYGGLEPGSVLPPERELAAQFGVSRGSLREAIRVLDHVGVLEVRTRSGTYIADDALTKGSLLRAQAAMADQESPLDIMIARRALEPVNARHAAVNRRLSDLRTMEQSVRDQRRLISKGEDPEDVDRDFHRALASASHNPMLYALFETIANAMSQDMWKTLKHKSRDQHGRQTLYVDQHTIIVQAIEAGDSEASVRAVIEHLDAVEEGLSAEVG